MSQLCTVCSSCVFLFCSCIQLEVVRQFFSFSCSEGCSIEVLNIQSFLSILKSKNLLTYVSEGTFPAFLCTFIWVQLQYFKAFCTSSLNSSFFTLSFNFLTSNYLFHCLNFFHSIYFFYFEADNQKTTTNGITLFILTFIRHCLSLTL